MATAHREGGAPGGVIVPLQCLRGLAAACVVIVHLLERLVKRGAFPQSLPDWVWSFGETGVATFFAISGFIMVHTTSANFGQAGAGRRFLLRRYFRIAPIYYLTSIMMLVFGALTFRLSTNAPHSQTTLAQIVMSLLFVPYIDYKGNAHPVYELGWTLEYEMFFYLVFALAMALPRRYGLALVVVLLLGLVGLGTMIAPLAPMIGMPVPVYFFTRPVLLYFVIGVIIALWRQRFGMVSTAMPDSVTCLMAIAALACGVRFGSSQTAMVNAMAVMVALAVATMLDNRQDRSAIFNATSRAFGNASYSLYLTHSFFLGAIAALSAHLVARSPLALFPLILVTCIFCAVMAWLTWRWVEVPVARLLRHEPVRRSEASGCEQGKALSRTET